MVLVARGSLAFLVVAAALSLPLLGLGSCGGTTAGAGGVPTTTSAGTGAGGSTGVVLVGTGGSSSSGTCAGPPPGDAGDDGATGCDGLEGGVTFATVAPLFQPCASETCHATPWLQPELVNVPSNECCDGLFLVTPGNADRSYLLDKLEGVPRCLPSRMPLNGPPYLSDADVLLIRRWICEGAPAD